MMVKVQNHFLTLYDNLSSMRDRPSIAIAYLMPCPSQHVNGVYLDFLLLYKQLYAIFSEW